MNTISRNDPCPCGSGKKHKKCCWGKTENAVRPATAQRPRIVETDLDAFSNRVNDLIRQGQWDEAERLCQSLREAFPDELDADDRLAQLYQAKENYPQALVHARAALDKARGHPDRFDPDLVTDFEVRVAFLVGKAGV